MNAPAILIAVWAAISSVAWSASTTEGLEPTTNKPAIPAFTPGVPTAEFDEEEADPLVSNGEPGTTGTWRKCSRFLRGRIYHSAIWTYASMIVWGGGSEHLFYNDGAIYEPVSDQWRAVATAGAPSGRWGHAAVWTGKEMVIWGGRGAFAPSDHKADGAIYNPETNTWRPMTTDGAPEARSQMAAVWTGEELLVWGGWSNGGECLASGASYNPREDRWSPLPAAGAPAGRVEPAYTWTGRELIVWGGLLQGGLHTAGSGGRYDPEKKSWRPVSTEGAPASARGLHAFWTGKEMIVWGGAHLDGDTPVNIGLNTGGRYNPVTDSWQSTQLTGAPEGRMYYSGAWTDTELIVWSGGDQQRGLFSTGGRYDPQANRWHLIPEAGAPTGRSLATAVWTGEGVLFFGGSTGGVEAFDDTYYFLPSAKTHGHTLK